MPVDYLLQQQEEWGKKLAKTEEELNTLKKNAKTPFPEDTYRAIQRQIGRVQDDLLDARRELLQREALVGGSAQTNMDEMSVPADRLDDYTFTTGRLEELKRQLNELRLQYTDAYPLVQNLRDRIEKLTQQKADLEKQDPGLALLRVNGSQPGTNAIPTNVLRARVNALGKVLDDLQKDAAEIIGLQPKLAELERRRTEQQRTYESVIARSQQTQMDESRVAGKVINISPVQSPTPPGMDHKKMLKLIGAVLVGCVGLGLGLAFLIDMFLDRSIKRASEIERRLRLPVFLSIPDTGWGGWLGLPKWLCGFSRGQAAHSNGAGGNGAGQGGGELAPLDPGHQLQGYAEGLRERIISYFEVHNLNLKKPKLVAVTGCDDGAGVSTLASGLAVALSKTGDGNVLLVDMNVNQGMAHSFYKGKPGCGISDALEPDNRAGAQVQENLYLATLNNGGGDKLSRILPTRFNHLMPRLKASDYDYIIFDMPPVTQTSATPRLASYMDLALLVIEAEKTGQHSAVRASSLMREARANVAAVLNKHRSHMPAGLSQEA